MIAFLRYVDNHTYKIQNWQELYLVNIIWSINNNNTNTDDTVVSIIIIYLLLV